MPELPDLVVYVDHLDRRVTGETLRDVRLASPFVLRSVSPTVDDVRGRVVTGCGAPIQRIVHAEKESNYCARCRTGGRVLADRSLSKLLKETWPRRIEELEGIDAGSSR